MRGNDSDMGRFADAKVDQFPLRLAYNVQIVVREAPPESHADATIVCGFLGCDLQPFNPLNAALPRLLHLRASEDDAWLAKFTEQAVAESHARRPGGEAMLARSLRGPRVGADARRSGAGLDG